MKKSIKYFIGFTFILLTIFIGYYTERSDFSQLIGLYFGLFSLYLLAYRNTETQSQLRFYIGVGIFARLVLLFAMPNLSDDIYRFIWDGKLWHAGFNPFDALPSDYVQNGFPEGLNTELYDNLNSPNYFTIYPPIAQLTFYLATFTNSVWWSSVIMKLFLFGFELGIIFLLIKMKIRNENEKLNSSKSDNESNSGKLFHYQRILLYILNPLIIIEIVGNLHFEGVMIFFLLLAFYWLKKDWWKLSAVAFACSVASKLLPLMFLPFLIHKLGWKKGFQYFIIVGSVTVALFYPLLGEFFINNFGNSLNLYFQKFEFNASLYYALRWLGFQVSGYNLIQILGPILALSAGITIFILALKNKSKKINILPKQWLIAITIYLFCTTTVHPWYTALPIVLCVFTNLRFPILWSALIFLTYVNYSYAEYFENLWIVGLEYLVLIGFMIWEKSNLKIDFS